MKEKIVILVVDDEGDIYKYSKRYLGDSYILFWVKSGPEALKFLEEHPVDLILLDKNFNNIPNKLLFGKNPENEGLFIHKEIKRRWTIPTLLVTSYADPQSVSQAIRFDVTDYIEWDALSVNREILGFKIEKILREGRLEKEALIGKYNAYGLIGRSEKMQEVFRCIDKIAKKDVTVFIIGATGTGKEMVAKTIHKESLRSSSPFIPSNLSAIPSGLIESELFGYKRGAFTGAVRNKPGFFEIANKGTLFIDEVSNLSLELQAKLLRVLEDSTFFPLGSKSPITVDVRLIAATNKPLKEKIMLGSFREDLYYRLNVFTIHLPPLEERREDIPLIVDYYVSFYSRTKGFDVYSVTRQAKEFLVEKEWPGNVRQLENTVLHALSWADKVLTLKDVMKAYEEMRRETGERLGISESARNLISSLSLKELERLAIEETLKAHGWDYKNAARSLGIGLSTLYTKAREYGINQKKR